MPSFDYSKSYDAAEKLLDKFGGIGTLTKITFTIPDSTKPWTKVEVETDHTIKMVVVPLAQQDITRYFNEDVIKADKKGIVLWNDSAVLELGDRVSYQGDSYVIAAARPIKPVSTGIINICALVGEG